MKKPVGFIFVEAVLAPLCDPQEPACSELAAVDGADERQMRQVIRNYVKPYYESFDDQSKATISNSILYFAHAENLPETMPLDALPTSFELTQEIDVLCAWLLAELCIESKEFDLGECEYSDNLSLVHRLRRTVRPGNASVN